MLDTIEKVLESFAYLTTGLATSYKLIKEIIKDFKK